MKNIKNAQWIKSPKIFDNASTEFKKEFSIAKPVKKATVEATAYGVYNIILNGKKVGDYIFAPGWTSYHNRLQVETYDITDLLINNNTIILGVGPGWKCPNFFNSSRLQHRFLGIGEMAVIAAIEIEYEDGTTEIINTDESWINTLGKTTYSHLYNGYTYDATFTDNSPVNAVVIPMNNNNLIDRDGEKITEHEHLPVKEIITTQIGRASCRERV